MLKTREEVIEYARQIYITTGLPPRRDQIVKAGVMHYRDFKQYFRSIDEVLLILGIESYAVTIREQKVVHKECAVCNKKFKTKFHNRVTCSQQCENIHTGNTDLGNKKKHCIILYSAFIIWCPGRKSRTFKGIIPVSV